MDGQQLYLKPFIYGKLYESTLQVCENGSLGKIQILEIEM